jgi:hypothetical protein
VTRTGSSSVTSTRITPLKAFCPSWMIRLLVGTKSMCSPYFTTSESLTTLMKARGLAIWLPLENATAHQARWTTLGTALHASKDTAVIWRRRRGGSRKTCGTQAANTGKTRRATLVTATARSCGTAVTATVLADWTTAVTCIRGAWTYAGLPAVAAP